MVVTFKVNWFYIMQDLFSLFGAARMFAKGEGHEWILFSLWALGHHHQGTKEKVHARLKNYCSPTVASIPRSIDVIYNSFIYTGQGTLKISHILASSISLDSSKKDIKIHWVLVFSSLENFKSVTVCSWFQGKFLICLQMTAFWKLCVKNYF